MELRKWKLAFAEQHKLALRKEREKHEADMAAVCAEMDGLKDLLHTYEISSQRKDEVCVVLCCAYTHHVDHQATETCRNEHTAYSPDICAL